MLLPFWKNRLHGAVTVAGLFEILSKSAGQPALLPADTWLINRIFSAVICLWAPVCDLICMIRTAWMYFLQVFAMSKEITADAIETKRAKMMHEIFILLFVGCFAFVELIKLNISCWWRSNFFECLYTRFQLTSSTDRQLKRGSELIFWGASGLAKWKMLWDRISLSAFIFNCVYWMTWRKLDTWQIKNRTYVRIMKSTI